MHKQIFCLVLVLFFATYSHSQTIRGIWYLTWSTSITIGDSNMGVAFSGWVDPDSALSDSLNVKNKIVGDKYISLGGGNGNGHWTSAVLSKISSRCTGGQFAGYKGLVYDIEEGDSGLSSAFSDSFRICKGAGFKIMVTVSHAAPYGIGDSQTLMKAIISNSYVDYFSPQLYTSGTETANDFSVDSTLGISWADYKPVSGKLVPAIVQSSLYNNAKTYFANQGITTIGFVQWSQTAGIPPSAPSPTANPTAPPPSGGGSSTVRCGADWTSASTSCGKACTTDADCSGQKCFADLPACTTPTKPPTTPPKAPTKTPTTTPTKAPTTPPKAPTTPPKAPANPIRCGTTWTDANAACGKACTTDGDCASGTHCWADLSLTPCGAKSLDADASSTADSGLSPVAIGLIIGGCILVLIIGVIIVAVRLLQKTESERF